MSKQPDQAQIAIDWCQQLIEEEVRQEQRKKGIRRRCNQFLRSPSALCVGEEGHPGPCWRWEEP